MSDTTVHADAAATAPAETTTTTRPTSLRGVRHIVMVLSGKGGVGKSTVACQLAMSLAYYRGLRVGLLDVDICGPSVPTICGVADADVYRDEAGWRPVAVRLRAAATGRNKKNNEDEKGGSHDDDDVATTVGSLHVMSIAYLLPSDRDAVVWRGPKKDAMIKQFVADVCWGNLDYLIIDTPPGTSDEHLTLCEVLAPYRPSGAVVVTTPQHVATDDVKKELSFCHALHIRCLGIVENMCGFVCPYCAHCTDVFARGGGARLAARYEVAFLGAIPVDPLLSLAEDRGSAFLDAAAEDERTSSSQQQLQQPHDTGGVAAAQTTIATATHRQTVDAVNAVIDGIVQQVERADTA